MARQPHPAGIPGLHEVRAVGLEGGLPRPWAGDRTGVGIPREPKCLLVNRRALDGRKIAVSRIYREAGPKLVGPE